jgi:hypothetical protein
VASQPSSSRPQNEISAGASSDRAEPGTADAVLAASGSGPSPPPGFGRFSTLSAPLQRIALRSAEADDAVVQRSLYLLSSRSTESAPDLPATALFLFLPGLEAVTQSSFGGYSALEFKGRQGAAVEEAAALVVGYYSWLDERLASLWSRLPEPRLMVVVSAFGARTDRGIERIWASVWPQRRLAGRIDGAPDGVLLLRAEGLLPGHFVSGAKIVDLAPTLLYAVGFPVARDFDGRVLNGAFSDEFLRRRPVTFVPSYETLSETRGRPRSQVPPPDVPSERQRPPPARQLP